METDICIIGAGPAGLMAAIGATTEQAETTLLETNANAGCKLLATGGGRCNFTHAATIDELVRAFGKAGRFLRHSFHELSPDDVRELHLFIAQYCGYPKAAAMLGPMEEGIAEAQKDLEGKA